MNMKESDMNAFKNIMIKIDGGINLIKATQAQRGLGVVVVYSKALDTRNDKL